MHKNLLERLRQQQINNSGYLVDEVRFIMLGESITQDIFAATTTVEAEIEAAYPGITAHVFEEGTDSIRVITVDDTIDTLLSSYPAVAYPTYVVINLGTNDLSDHISYTDATPTQLTNFSNAFDTIISSCISHGFIPILNEIYYRENDANTFNNQELGSKPYNDNIIKAKCLSSSPDFCYLDGTSFYQSYNIYYNGRATFFADVSYPHLHPNATGIAAFRTHFVDTICKKIITGINPIIVAIDSTDFDQDGNPVTTDPDDTVVNVIADSFTAFNGQANSFNVLSNDDFLPGSDITLVDLGTGTAGGTISFNNLTGNISYTPLVGEIGSTVTVDYRVTYVPSGVFGDGTVTISVSAALDTDAAEYIDALELTTTLTAVEISAINDLVITLKADGTWDTLYAMYLPIWADADANKYNLKDTFKYNISWSGSLTHGTNGVLSDGTTGYGNTNINQNIIGTTNFTFGFYSGTITTTNAGYEMGVSFFGQVSRLNIVEGSTHSFLIQGLALSPTFTASSGLHIGTRVSSTDIRYAKNNTIIASSTTSASPTAPNLNIYLLAHNSNGAAAAYSNLQCRVAFIGIGISDTQIADMYTAIQTFLTTLGKQI